MYHIRYRDPMTGTVLETQSASLMDAVNAIQKAKDDLYYRGYPSAAEEQQMETPPAQEEPPAETTHNDTDEDDIDIDDYVYPYGVTLW